MRDNAVTGRLVIRRCHGALSLQDGGRQGYQRYGLSGSGAMDRLAMATANALVGNAPDAPVLEFGLGGGRFVMEAGQGWFACAGAPCTLRIDGAPLAGHRTATLAEGAELIVDPPREGAFVYLAVAGGFEAGAVLAAGPLGIMQACLDCVLPYVRERRQFNAPIGSFQLMQAKIADMVVALNSARAYVYAVARACDRGRATRADAAGAILLASENAVRVSLEAIQALGGAGYTKEWPVERFLRDAKLYDIGAGTNEIRRYLIGRELIGA